MRGHFSIEWLAQSSQGSGRDSLSAPSCTRTSTEPSTSGTHPESLPGFYCRQRPENQESQVRRAQGLDPRSHPNLASPEMGTQLQRSPHSHHNQPAAETGFSSATEEETSGYESEGGRSLSPTAPLDGTSTTPPSPPSGRRPRTAFTAEQISSLERAFKRNAYLGTQDKAELCKRLHLSDKQIRNWFQNRRMKLKRTVQDALAQVVLHYPELQQAYRPGPYPSYHPHQAQEGPTAASYLHCNPTTATPSLPLDSLYQYANLPGLVLPHGTSPLIGSYQPYHHQY